MMAGPFHMCVCVWCREAWPTDPKQVADIEKDFLPDIGDRWGSCSLGCCPCTPSHRVLTPSWHGVVWRGLCPSWHWLSAALPPLLPLDAVSSVTCMHAYDV